MRMFSVLRSLKCHGQCAHVHRKGIDNHTYVHAHAPVDNVTVLEILECKKHLCGIELGVQLRHAGVLAHVAPHLTAHRKLDKTCEMNGEQELTMVVMMVCMTTSA